MLYKDVSLGQHLRYVAFSNTTVEKAGNRKGDTSGAMQTVLNMREFGRLLDRVLLKYP